MLVEWNKEAAYRDSTRRMANSPSSTFLCSICKKGKSITGRKKVAQDGRRISYACKACQEPK